MSMTVAQKRYLQEKKEKGICRSCTDPVCAESTVYCSKHRLQRAEWQRKNNNKNKQEKLNGQPFKA